MRDKLMTRQEVADIVRISVRELDRMERDKEIPSIRLRRRVLYSANKIAELLEQKNTDFNLFYKSFDGMWFEPTNARRRFKRQRKLRKQKKVFEKLFNDFSENREKEGDKKREEMIRDLWCLALEISNMEEEEYADIESSCGQMMTFVREICREEKMDPESDEFQKCLVNPWAYMDSDD